MAGKSKTVIVIGVLALAVFGTGAALASGGEEAQQGSTQPTAPGTEQTAVVENVSNEVQDIDGRKDTEEANEVEGVEETNTVQEAGDSSEDIAEGPDVPITGTDLDQASAVALDYLGEGRVTATEVGDEESYYEVEVTLDDGSQVDVQLDESLIVVGTD